MMKRGPTLHNTESDGRPVFEYEEAPPPAALRDVILSFWTLRTTEHCPPQIEHTVWPDGCASLCVVMIPGGRSFAIGIQARTDARLTTVHRGSRYWGIRFWPDTASVAFGVAAGSLVDGPVPARLSSTTSSLANALADPANDDGWRVLERWSLENIPPAPVVDPVVRAALRHIVLTNGSARVAEVAEAVGVGLRQLQRRFADATGLTIKAYSRVRRLRSALARQLAVKEPISRTAAERGYADHAHLAREFAEMTGMAPTNVMRHLARIEHRNVVP
jgi:AraC-like DNA-binding protein